MKTLLITIALSFALSVSGQKVDELKAYIDSQKEFTQVAAGERWIDLYVDTEFERKGLSDSLILTVSFEAKDQGFAYANNQYPPKYFDVNGKRYFARDENFIIGDTTFIPRQNRHSFRKVYLENGTVKYQQLFEMLVLKETEKSKELILIEFNKKAKNDKIKDNDFTEVQKYILKGKAVAGDSVLLKDGEVIGRAKNK